MFKENFAYIILALVAIALIGITIGLQIVILSDQPTTADGTSIELGTQTTATGSNRSQLALNSTTDQVAINLNSADEEPELIVLEPEAEQPAAAVPTSTAISIAPTEQPAALADTVDEGAAENMQPAVDPQSVAQGLTATNGATDSGANVSAQPKETVMGATNVTASDDNRVLAAIVESDPYAISFIPFAFYQEMESSLRPIDLRSSTGDIVQLNLESVASGQYPLARPLFIYSTIEAIQEKPDVRSFINCYLNQVSEEITDIGYFRLSSSRFAQSITNFNVSTGEPDNGLVPCNPISQGATTINIIGSATVTPITQKMVELFQADGYGGSIEQAETGTGGGFKRLCEDGDPVDVINASRPIKESELAACRSRGIEPVVFPIGADALAIIVNPENTFVESLSYAELWHTFSYAKFWSDVNPAWPSEPIIRAVRRVNSGTLDFFVDEVFENEFDYAAAAGQTREPVPAPEPIQPETETAAASPAAEPATTAAGSVAGSADITFGVLDRGHNCRLMTEVVKTVLEEELQLVGRIQSFDDPESLYQDLALGAVDVTLCYIDPDDRQHMANWLGEIRQIGTNHWAEGNYKMLTWAKGSSKASYRSDRRCLLDLLEKVAFEPDSLQDEDSAAWINQNGDAVQSWLTCPYDN